MLQIGLVNFGTFVQYLANPSEAPAYNAGIVWLLSATSNDFENRTFLGVGVEPVVEHLKELEGLAGPNTTLVHAAVRDADGYQDLYALPSNMMLENTADAQDGIEAELLYLRNMSSVGQPSTDMMQRLQSISCSVKPRKVPTVTITSLAAALNFRGCEVLVVDAEGDDYRILLSLLDYMKTHRTSEVLPDVIQYETMGHCNEKENFEAEKQITVQLQNEGYILACFGYNTLVIHQSKKDCVRIHAFSQTIFCQSCYVRGFRGMPFGSKYLQEARSWRTMCSSCFHSCSAQ